MALTFSAGRLSKTVTTTGPTPYTMACWFNLTAAANAQVMISIGSTLASFSSFDLVYYGQFDQCIRAEANNTANTTDDDNAKCNPSISTGTWHHGCVVFTSTTSRACFLDGGNKGTSALTVTPTASDMNTMGIGDIIQNNSWQAHATAIIAFPAYWNVALSDSDVASLALGMHPRRMRPSNLIACANLIGASPEPDLVAPAWTIGGTAPVLATNPRIY